MIHHSGGRAAMEMVEVGGAEGLRQEVVFQIQICFIKWLVFLFPLFRLHLFVPNSACVHAALPFQSTACQSNTVGGNTVGRLVPPFECP